MTVALSLSQEAWLSAEKAVSKDIQHSDRVVGVALRFMRRVLDPALAWAIHSTHGRLEQDILTLKGAAKVVADMNEEALLDSGCVKQQQLARLEQMILALHGESLKGRQESARARMHRCEAAFIRSAELTSVLYDTVNELKWAVAEHDADNERRTGRLGAVYAAEDIERFLEDLKK